jgi:hypothetical protein
MRPIKKNPIPPILQEICERLYGKHKDLSIHKNAYEEYICNNYFPKGKEDCEPINPKKDIQEALIEEQGFVCCYCMRAISLDKMIIEHFKPEGLYNGQKAKDISAANKNNLTAPYGEEDTLEDLTIQYSNLLAACKHDSNHQCDNKKSGYELIYLPNPASLSNKEFEQKCKIFYTKSGAIQSENEGINTEIGGKVSEDDNTIYSKGQLNLNNIFLKDARKNAWSHVKKNLSTHLGFKENSNWTDELKKRSKTAIVELENLIGRYEQRRKKDNSFYPFYGYVLYELNKLLRKINT